MYEELLEMDEAALTAALEELTVDELEQVIIDLDNAEAKRWQRTLVSAAYDRAYHIQNISKMLTNIDATFFVMDISQSFAVAASSVVPSPLTATIWFFTILKPLYTSPPSKCDEENMLKPLSCE